MSLSLKDQLIAAGLVKKDAPSSAKPHTQKPAVLRPASPPPPRAPKPAAIAANAEPTLAQLYKARDQQLLREQEAAKKLAQDKARAKTERKQKVLAIIAGADQSLKDAEFARHFQYAKKIRRIYLNALQREALNAGQLGLVQMDGRFHLLSHELVTQVHQIAPEFVALMGASAEAQSTSTVTDERYQDEKFQVPDDLTW
jgi:uncharacterized protein YaiL (DUF2058 family)